MDQHVLDRYNSPQGAKSYRGKFARHWNERLNNVREQHLLQRLLNGLAHSERALDMPCGYGRLCPAVQTSASKVVESDWSFYLLREAQENLAQTAAQPPLGFVRVTAMNLPYADQAFGLVLSVRLSHHIPTQEERMLHVSELMRVSSRYVVFTYFDSHSLKNRVHRAKRRFVPKRAKYTLSQADVAQAAAAAGFQVVRAAPLSRLFSGHRYTVLERMR